MCDILDDLVQSYSPSTTDVVNTEVEQTHQDTKVHPIPLGGDQLTVARVRSAQKLRSNEYTSVDRLEGVIPFAQDWHTFLAFLEVRYCTVPGMFKHTLFVIFPGHMPSTQISI